MTDKLTCADATWINRGVHTTKYVKNPDRYLLELKDMGVEAIATPVLQNRSNVWFRRRRYP